MSKKHVSGKINASYIVKTINPCPLHTWCICLGRCHFMLSEWHWRLRPQTHQKFSRSLEARGPQESDSSLLRGSPSCPYKQAASRTEPWRPGRSQHCWTEGRVNIFGLLGEQERSSLFCRGNRVYIVTLGCEENAMICFDGSPNVPVKCECACLIASCAKHSTECVVLK